MAVNSRDRRFSMMGLGQPVPSVLPEPSGSIDTQGRAMLLFLYHGIALEVAVIVEGLSFGVLSFMSQHGQGVTATISQSIGVLAIIGNDGQDVEGKL